MKIFHHIMVCLALTQLAGCQQVRESKYKLRVEVLDEQNNPISGASVHTSRLVLAPGTIQGKMKRNPVVVTDRNGIALV